MRKFRYADGQVMDGVAPPGTTKPQFPPVRCKEAAGYGVLRVLTYGPTPNALLLAEYEK